MSSKDEDFGVLREVPVPNLTISSISSKINTYDQKNRYDKKSELPSFLGIEDDTVKKPISRTLRSTISLLLKDKKIKKEPVDAGKLIQKGNKILNNLPRNIASVESSSICKMLASMNISEGNELEAICNLIASQATCLRQQILYRNLKKQIRNALLNEPIVKGLGDENLNVFETKPWDPKKLISVLAELPSDWHVVQITAPPELWKDERYRVQPSEYMYSLKPMHQLFLTVLPTGKKNAKPICIVLPKPNSDYDIRKEIESLLNENKVKLTTSYGSNSRYWKMRKEQNEKMNKAISEFEFSWLREWRILLLGDYLENLDLVKDVTRMIEKLVADDKSSQVSDRTTWLLKKIALGACFLETWEIERAVKYVLPNSPKLAKNVILSIVAKSHEMLPLTVAKRKVLILILDESLDHISFESMSFLKNQPVTRFPSIHIANALFQEHKKEMEGGYKIIKMCKNLGTFIVNPSNDLPKMELRIKAFLDYWLPEWKGVYQNLEDEFFKQVLVDRNVVMYNGHGSGMQYLKGEIIEKIRVLAVVLLFGCSSVKLSPVGGRSPCFGISNQYLIAASPCILGMLWEVTDADIDLMTTDFMRRWIPSATEKMWGTINEKAWHKGEIEFTKKFETSKTMIENDNDMLTAVAKSKGACLQYMTSAAIVMRGLPIKLVK